MTSDKQRGLERVMNAPVDVDTKAQLDFLPEMSSTSLLVNYVLAARHALSSEGRGNRLQAYRLAYSIMMELIAREAD